jgi:hypothetical protein
MLPQSTKAAPPVRRRFESSRAPPSRPSCTRARWIATTCRGPSYRAPRRLLPARGPHRAATSRTRSRGQARAVRHRRRVRQTPVRVHGASPAPLVLFATRARVSRPGSSAVLARRLPHVQGASPAPLVLFAAARARSPARRSCEGSARTAAASKVALAGNRRWQQNRRRPRRSGFGSSLARRAVCFPLGAAPRGRTRRTRGRGQGRAAGQSTVRPPDSRAPAFLPGWRTLVVE